MRLHKLRLHLPNQHCQQPSPSRNKQLRCRPRPCRQHRSRLRSRHQSLLSLPRPQSSLKLRARNVKPKPWLSRWALKCRLLNRLNLKWKLQLIKYQLKLTLSNLKPSWNHKRSRNQQHRHQLKIVQISKSNNCHCLSNNLLSKRRLNQLQNPRKKTEKLTSWRSQHSKKVKTFIDIRRKRSKNSWSH